MNIPHVEFINLDVFSDEVVHFEIESEPFVTLGLVLEIIAQCIFPWPKCDNIFFMPQYAASGVEYVPYFTSDMIMLFMFWRVYTVLRHMERYHEFTDMYSKKVCRTYGFKPGRMFTIKIELLKNPTRMTLWLSAITIFLLAFVVRVFELPYEKNKKIDELNLANYGSSIYMTVITLTSVGYGDLYPSTSGGQAVIMFTALWGAFIVSLLVLVASSIFEFKPEEDKAIRFIRQSRAASKSILLALKFFMEKKKFYIHKMRIDPDFVVNSSFLKMIKEQEKNRQNHQNVHNNCDHLTPTLYDEVIQTNQMREVLNRNVQNKMLAQIKSKVQSEKNNEKTILIGKEMNAIYIKLQESLKDFIVDKKQYDVLLDENATEMLNSNRVIKKEVIDMSDLVEKLSQIVLTQN